MAVGNRCASLRGYRRKVRAAMRILFLFDKPIEASDAIYQFGW